MRRSLALEAFYEEAAEGEAVQDPTKTETVAAPTDADPVPPVQNDTPPADEAELVPPVEEEDVSLESLVTTLGMAIEEMVEIGANLREAERAIQTSDALDDLAHVAKSIETATPAQAALIETVGDMAVAGTDVEPDAIVPSLEQYVGRSVALEAEGIKDRAKKIWEAIVAFVARIWERIRAFWRGLQLGYYAKKLETLAKELESYPENPEGKVNVSEAYREVVGSDERFLGMTMTMAFSELAQNVLHRGEVIADAINKYDPKDPEKATSELYTRLKKVTEAVKDKDTEVDLPGGYRLSVKHVNGEDHASALAALERLRNAGASFEKLPNYKGKSLSERSEFALPNRLSATMAIGSAGMLIGVLNHFYAETFKKLDEQGDKIKRASDSLAKDLPADANGGTEEFRALVNFYKAYATWTYQPFAPFSAYIVKLCAHVMSDVSTIIKAAKKGTKTDDKKEEKKEEKKDAKSADSKK
jgi:hypothetical protein